MDSKTAAKIAASAAICVASVVGLSGVVTKEEMTYALPTPAAVREPLDPAVQDGVYRAESVNAFSTVSMEMTIAGREITDCVIESSGDNDLMTSEQREEWAKAIVEQQTAQADVITGATLTYSAASVQEAFDDIMAQASGMKPAVGETPAAAEAPAPEAQETAEAPAPEAPETAEAPAPEAQETAETPAPEEQETPAAETPEDTAAEPADPARLMRTRPAGSSLAETPAAEAPEVQAAETPENTAAEPADPARLMRTRPAGSSPAETPAAEAPEVPAAETPENTAAEPADPARLMRTRPAGSSLSETPATEAPETTASEPADPARLMRARPVMEAVTEPLADSKAVLNDALPTDANGFSEGGVKAVGMEDPLPEKIAEEMAPDTDRLMRPGAPRSYGVPASRP